MAPSTLQFARTLTPYLETLANVFYLIDNSKPKPNAELMRMADEALAAVLTLVNEQLAEDHGADEA
jgi:hypothetical protein